MDGETVHHNARLIYDKNKDRFLYIVRLDIYGQIYNGIKNNDLVKKLALRNNFDKKYQLITDTEPDDDIYKEYIEYARKRFFNENSDYIKDVSSRNPVLSLDTSNEGNRSAPHTIETGREGKFSFGKKHLLNLDQEISPHLVY